MKFLIAFATLCLVSLQVSGKPGLNPFIIGGDDAELGELPYQAHLGGCGASIYKENWVITAAHCVDRLADRATVRAGFVSQSSPGDHVQSKTVEKKWIHPNYGSDGNNFDGDVALLKLEEPFELTDHVNTIEIPPQGYKAETTFLVSGWGSTSPWKGGATQKARQPRVDHLQKVEVPFVTDEVCRNAYASEGVDVLDQEVCAGDFENGGVDSCQGDSGGPLVEIKTGYLSGIVSWGAGCARPGYPGVYAEVAYYTDWINGIIEENS